jgi:Ca2+-binding RTX toxin-like protein
MGKKYTYQIIFGPTAGYEAVSFGTRDLPNVVGQPVSSSLYAENGAEKLPFADLTGYQILKRPDLATGTSGTDGIPDTLAMDGGSQFTTLVWDTRAVEQNGSFYDLYTAYGGGRYGLPGGHAGQEGISIEVLTVAQNNGGGDHSHDFDRNVVNLSFNSVAGGVSYDLAITIIGGPGRDLFIAGQGSDVIYGGDSHVIGVAGDPLGDGMWGMGGNDTIYAGRDIGNSAADDLYGYSGNDVLYGANDGDVYYGDSGSDVIYGSTSNGASVPGFNGNNVTFFGGDGNDTMYASTGALNTKEFFIGGNANSGWGDAAFTENANGADTGGNMDLVSYATSTAAVTVNLGDVGTYTPNPIAFGTAIPNGAAVGTGAGGAVNDIFYQIEGIIGGSGADTIMGNAGTVGNYFAGLAGNDTLQGLGGNDTLYGGDNDDTVDGGADDDTLYGGLGGDTAIGGSGNDLIFADQDQVFGAATTTGWDGTSGVGGTISVAVTGKGHNLGTVDGGTGTDTYNFSPNATGSGGTALGYGGALDQRIYGIELIVGSAAADVVNLTFHNGTTGVAYSGDVTVTPGDGGDYVFTGSGNDRIIGDVSTGGADTLFGGAGEDVIFGDLVDTTSATGGADSLSGGDGNDTIYGGAGDDRIGDLNTTTSATTGTHIDGGAGADIINAAFNNVGAKAVFVGGLNSGTDGADAIIATGTYDSASANMGLGNDLFVGGAGTGNNIDRVFGEDGNDALSAWSGTDTLDGGSGNDMLWGGAGTDTIYGGIGSDSLYPGGGGSNIMYGGGGEDYYYISRNDGTGNQLFDQVRSGGAADANNYIVVFGEFNMSEVGGDFLLNGAGIHEVDHNITDSGQGNDMVQIVNAGGHLWTLTVLGTGANVQFDDRDIQGIGLWNNDANPGQEVIESYMWNGVTYVYQP